MPHTTNQIDQQQNAVGVASPGDVVVEEVDVDEGLHESSTPHNEHTSLVVVALLQSSTQV